MRWRRILLAVAGVLFLGLLVAVFFRLQLGGTPDETDLPQFIQADFIELDRIASVSKFRSGSGHDFSSGGESCRSMKHYFSPPYDPTSQSYRDAHEGYPPPPDGETDIIITSPVDGTITNLPSEHNDFGQQVYIRPNQAKDFTVRLFHIFLDEGVEKGTKLTAGQRIGVISAGQNTDVAVQRGGFGQSQFVSYFTVMPDAVFAAYQARGIASREELIVTKEYRTPTRTSAVASSSPRTTRSTQITPMRSTSPATLVIRIKYASRITTRIEIQAP